MKVLDGSELAGFIKERQARQVRALRQASHVFPKLAIIVTVEHPAIDVYMRMKQRYGADIQIDVEVHRIEQSDAPEVIARLNADPGVHGIIVQLPLQDVSQIDDVLNAVSPDKDVDGLHQATKFEPATPMAILWLLAGYNVSYEGKKIVLVGRGTLVGAPLERFFIQSKQDVSVVDRQTPAPAEIIRQADLVITATGQPNLITADMIKPNAVVFDAGVAGEQGKTVGDLADDVYERSDLTITPRKGGVGPLTVCALFENVIRAAQSTVPKA